MMTVARKFRILIVLTTTLVVFMLLYNIFQEYFMTEIGEYLQRRIYYQSVIAKKGLSLHKGMYWKEKE